MKKPSGECLLDGFLIRKRSRRFEKPNFNLAVPSSRGRFGNNNFITFCRNVNGCESFAASRFEASRFELTQYFELPSQ